MNWFLNGIKLLFVVSLNKIKSTVLRLAYDIFQCFKHFFYSCEMNL